MTKRFLIDNVTIIKLEDTEIFLPMFYVARNLYGKNKNNNL